MLDSLSLVLALTIAPDSSRIIPPPPAAPIVVARAEEEPSESLTTCYQSRSGSCWTEE